MRAFLHVNRDVFEHGFLVRERHVAHRNRCWLGHAVGCSHTVTTRGHRVAALSHAALLASRRCGEKPRQLVEHALSRRGFAHDNSTVVERMRHLIGKRLLKMQAFNQLMLFKEGFRRSFKRNATVVQGNHVVSGNHFVHEMRYVNNSLSSCTEFLDKAHDVISMHNVKSCGRFVKNQNLRLHDQRARDGHALLLAA